MKNRLKKLSVTLPIFACFLFLFTGMASAHVTVKPTVSAPGAWETYTIKIPVEKEIPTTKVTLKMPKGVEFQQYQPVPGWKVTTDKDSSGKVTTITWEATDGGIMPGEFQQFHFVAKNPEDQTKSPWDAYQYYKDGTIVEWTGDEGSDKPHSITEITTATSNTTPVANENHHKATSYHEDHDEAKSDSNIMSVTTLVLSIVALLVAIAAFVSSRRKK